MIEELNMTQTHIIAQIMTRDLPDIRFS